VKHTIISWDCSFRNFFHLLDALVLQDYDRNEFEVFYVEQRSRVVADEFNHKLGLPSLADRAREVSDSIQVCAEYLGDPAETPYHLGRSVNRGLELARGEIISVMDGDMLLPPDFLTKLENCHASGAGVVNLARRMASRPVGATFENWTEGRIDFNECLKVCPDATAPVPRVVSNKGPMISASAVAWRSIGGYDPHPIWSTGLTRLGQDANSRLELHLTTASTALPDAFAVHPYHPAGFSRLTLDASRVLDIHADLIHWARQNREVTWQARGEITQQHWDRNRKLFKRLHEPCGETLVPHPGSSVVLGKLYRFSKKIIGISGVQTGASPD
jgi:hypothetical protein